MHRELTTSTPDSRRIGMMLAEPSTALAPAAERTDTDVAFMPQRAAGSGDDIVPRRAPQAFPTSSSHASLTDETETTAGDDEQDEDDNSEEVTASFAAAASRAETAPVAVTAIQQQKPAVSSAPLAVRAPTIALMAKHNNNNLAISNPREEDDDYSPCDEDDLESVNSARTMTHLIDAVQQSAASPANNALASAVKKGAGGGAAGSPRRDAAAKKIAGDSDDEDSDRDSTDNAIEAFALAGRAGAASPNGAAAAAAAAAASAATKKLTDDNKHTCRAAPLPVPLHTPKEAAALPRGRVVRRYTHNPYAWSPLLKNSPRRRLAVSVKHVTAVIDNRDADHQSAVKVPPPPVADDEGTDGVAKKDDFEDVEKLKETQLIAADHIVEGIPQYDDSYNYNYGAASAQQQHDWEYSYYWDEQTQSYVYYGNQHQEPNEHGVVLGTVALDVDGNDEQHQQQQHECEAAPLPQNDGDDDHQHAVVEGAYYDDPNGYAYAQQQQQQLLYDEQQQQQVLDACYLGAGGAAAAAAAAAHCSYESYYYNQQMMQHQQQLAAAMLYLPHDPQQAQYHYQPQFNAASATAAEQSGVAAIAKHRGAAAGASATPWRSEPTWECKFCHAVGGVATQRCPFFKGNTRTHIIRAQCSCCGRVFAM